MIEGKAIAGHTVGEAKGYVYIRGENTHAIAKLRENIDLAVRRITLFNIEFRVGADAYICADEFWRFNSIGASVAKFVLGCC